MTRSWIHFTRGRFVRQARVGLGDLREEHLSRQGFAGPVAMLYRTDGPNEVVRFEGDYRPRQVDSADVVAPDASDPSGGWQTLLSNEDVGVAISRRRVAMPYCYRDMEGDLLYFVHRGRGVFATEFCAGFGKRPALLVIDVNWAFCGERPEPILESIKRWRTSCGEESWVALEYIKTLIEAARARGLPVIYTTGERRPDNWNAGSWRWKSTRGDEASGSIHDGIDGNEIVAMIAPGPRDIVIKKQKPSGFFGTNLAAYLTLLGCDSVIIVGTTTSGCVRATAVDAFSLNYRVILAEEGCFDRSEASHAVSLCDMHAKYADVVPTAEVLSYFNQLPADLFDLPTGSGSRSSTPPVREAAQ